MKNQPDKARAALILGTLAFTISFAVWGLISGLMPILKKQLELSATEASLLVALPVMVGSLGRIPMGLLADRFGAKRVFSVLLFLIVLPALALGFANSYASYVTVAVLIGIAGAAFSVGVAFVSRWFPPEKQGTALGVYGAGNLGQSIAVFGAPVLAGALGINWAAWIFCALALIYAVIFYFKAEDAPVPRPQGSWVQAFADVLRNRNSWLLSIFYFQTFGGFVAFAVYMPMLLKELFALTPADAGFRTAVFVLLATFARPLGGWLSDQFPSERLLLMVFVGLLPCALLLTSHDLGYFTAGALAAAGLVGLGNGAVFKMVPHFFPKQIGTVTGIVGAAGGMGGFFPPLILGFFKDHGGSYNPGFYCLALFTLFCTVLLYFGVVRAKSNCQVNDASSEEYARV